MDFKTSRELLDICDSLNIPVSEVMRRREMSIMEVSGISIDCRMNEARKIMKASAVCRLNDPEASLGGLIGGEAKKLFDYRKATGGLCGNILGKAMIYALSVMETNASMGLIVAAPTAGSAGVIPGVVFALQDDKDFSDEDVTRALYCAGAIGYLAMSNATVSGAMGGCQAEVGVASAMAAAAAVELLGGTPGQCTDAASTALMNMLGLVCDPVGGFVEYPCQKRNVAGVANALTAAELSLAGISQLIPLDEMLDVMTHVGKRIPVELRETSMGGCAAAPAACKACSRSVISRV